jgi:hypothetical protein
MSFGNGLNMPWIDGMHIVTPFSSMAKMEQIATRGKRQDEGRKQNPLLERVYVAEYFSDDKNNRANMGSKTDDDDMAKALTNGVLGTIIMTQ